MYQEQRLEKILTLLEERGNLSVKEMVDALGVSKDTVRRDFDCLSQRNLAQRTHGGILPVKNTTVLGFQERQKGLTEDKKKMADLALSLVKDQSLLFFDVSTLMLEVSLFGQRLGPKWQRRNRLSSLGRKILQQKPLLLFASRSPALATSTI